VPKSAVSPLHDRATAPIKSAVFTARSTEQQRPQVSRRESVSHPTLSFRNQLSWGRYLTPPQYLPVPPHTPTTKNVLFRTTGL